MDNDTRWELERFLKASERLINALEKLQPAVSSSGMVVTSSSHAQKDSVGIYVTSVLASFMTGLCIMMAFNQIHQQKQIDDLHDYLNVIYQYAPQLKPRDFK